ncbi:MAG: STAS domain-containing protein [Vallitaleaceae bacterium]|nr:STAS domain-containing protein [Vallitaleaceae bacterium]
MIKTIQEKQIILTLTDGLTANKISSYSEQLGELLPVSEQYDTCILDLAQTTNIDSAGVTFVINLYKRMKASEKTFSVIGADDDVQNLFRLMKLDRFFDMKN